jgi:hypothetical protein
MKSMGINKTQMIKCKNCGIKDNQFVHDRKLDSRICTICGVVATHYWSPDKLNLNYEEHGPDVSNSYEDRATKKEHYRLMAKAFPKEERDRKRKRMIRNMGSKINASSSVISRATLLYDNYRQELIKIKPIKKMLLACLIVASRATNNNFIPMSRVKTMFHEEAGDINTFTKKVCGIIGMNQKTFSLASIPYVTSHLRFPVKYEKILVENYEKVGLIAPSMASETRLAIAACKLLKDNDMEIKFDYVAYLTDSVETAIRKFFEVNKRRKRETSIISNKKPKN